MQVQRFIFARDQLPFLLFPKCYPATTQNTEGGHTVKTKTNKQTHAVTEQTLGCNDLALQQTAGHSQSCTVRFLKPSWSHGMVKPCIQKTSTFTFFLKIGTTFANAYAANISKNNLQWVSCFFSVFSWSWRASFKI